MLALTRSLRKRQPQRRSVQRMQLMGTPRRLPSITAGFGLEIAGYIERPQQ